MSIRRVLIVLPFPAETGAGGRKKEAIETLLEAHARLGISTLTISCIPEFEQKNPVYQCISSHVFTFFKILSYYSGKNTRRITNYLWRKVLVRAVVKYQKRSNLDLALSYAMHIYPSRVCYEIHRRVGLKYFINDHQTIYQRLYPHRNLLPLKEKLSLDNAEIIFCLTESHKNSIEKVTDTKIEILPLALNDSFFDASSLSYSPSIRETPEDYTVIASLTNWRSIKRLDLLVAAFEQCLSENENLYLLIGGPVPEKENQKTIDKVTGTDFLNRKIRFLGSLSRDQVKELFYNIDICVIPSDHETFSIPASEALCAGVPVVTTICGGPENFINEGYNGYRVKRGSVKDLASKILWMSNSLSSFNNYEIMEESRKYFSVNNVSKILSEYYK